MMLLRQISWMLLLVSWFLAITESHAFVTQKVMGSCPTKINEQIQMMMHPRVPSTLGSLLFATTTDNRNVDAIDNFPKIIPTKGVPIHLYTNDIDPLALEQLTRLAESPLPTDYVSAMPDVHAGMGVTIGSVFASEKYICPNAVGKDIGCGMAAVPIDGLYKWQLTPDDKNQIQQLIKERIPTGFNQHRTSLPGTQQVIDEITADVPPTKFLEEMLLLPKVTDQLGTLGGGNHFLEVVHEEISGQVWVMLHSGSRNIGNEVATYHNNVAKENLMKKGVDTDLLRGINYMEIESEEGQNYLNDMEWCQRYAFHNRRVMKEIMLGIVEEVTGKPGNMAEAVNIHHNYCACENCGDGRKLWVTRKGATSAKLGELGIIPGSMGTGSFITRGKGNLLSWNSSAHGAGRRMSRTEANAKILQKDFEESMKGVVCDTHPGVKDEAPQAYKDLSVVMKNQESLTDIVYRLLPLINVKGFEEKLKKKYRTQEENRKILEKEQETLSKGIQKIKLRINQVSGSPAGRDGEIKTKLAKLEAKQENLEKGTYKMEQQIKELSGGGPGSREDRFKSKLAKLKQRAAQVQSELDSLSK